MLGQEGTAKGTYLVISGDRITEVGKLSRKTANLKCVPRATGQLSTAQVNT